MPTLTLVIWGISTVAILRPFGRLVNRYTIPESIHQAREARQKILRERFGHDLRRADAALVIQNNPDRLLRIISYRDKVKIAGADIGVMLFHARLHPAQQPVPI